MNIVKKILHIILVFYPYVKFFKDAMLSYPALRSETTIDWYMPWSQDALESVGSASLKKMDNLKSVVSVCVDIHKSVEKFAEKFMKETKRFTAITPSRYFELLTTFNSKLKKKQVENDELISKYSNGVDPILKTRKQIDEMSKKQIKLHKNNLH